MYARHRCTLCTDVRFLLERTWPEAMTPKQIREWMVKPLELQRLEVPSNLNFSKASNALDEATKKIVVQISSRFSSISSVYWVDCRSDEHLPFSESLIIGYCSREAADDDMQEFDRQLAAECQNQIAELNWISFVHTGLPCLVKQHGERIYCEQGE